MVLLLVGPLEAGRLGQAQIVVVMPLGLVEPPVGLFLLLLTGPLEAGHLTLGQRAAGGDDDGTAPGASHRGARGDDGAAPNRAPRREPSKAAAARGDDDGAAPAGTSRRETPNGGAAHGDGAGNRGGTSHGQPPRQPNPRTAVFEDVSKDDSADPGIAAPRGSASREGAATGASHNGPRASHGGRRRH